MKRLKVLLALLLTIFFICGCATTDAVKQQYKENKVEDSWDTGEEMKAVGKGMGRDFYTIFILPFKNILTGRIFKEYPNSSKGN